MIGYTPPMTTPARPAATVIILRDTEDGPEVLMLKRSGRAGFFPNAWVFPGGRVDEADGTAVYSLLKTPKCLASAALMGTCSGENILTAVMPVAVAPCSAL